MVTVFALTLVAVAAVAGALAVAGSDGGGGVRSGGSFPGADLGTRPTDGGGDGDGDGAGDEDFMPTYEDICLFGSASMDRLSKALPRLVHSWPGKAGWSTDATPHHTRKALTASCFFIFSSLRHSPPSSTNV